MIDCSAYAIVEETDADDGDDLLMKVKVKVKGMKGMMNLKMTEMRPRKGKVNLKMTEMRLKGIVNLKMKVKLMPLKKKNLLREKPMKAVKAKVNTVENEDEERADQ